MSTGRNDQAIHELERAAELSPEHSDVRITLSIAYLRAGRVADAVSEMERAIEPSHRAPYALATATRVYQAAGDATKVQEIIASLSRRDTADPCLLALAYAGLQNDAKTKQWLEKSYDERNCPIVEINNDPVFDFLRGNPRFQSLLGKLDLGGAQE